RKRFVVNQLQVREAPVPLLRLFVRPRLLPDLAGLRIANVLKFAPPPEANILGIGESSDDQLVVPIRRAGTMVFGSAELVELPDNPADAATFPHKPLKDLVNPAGGLLVDHIGHPRLGVASAAGRLCSGDRHRLVAQAVIAYGKPGQQSSFLAAQ